MGDRNKGCEQSTLCPYLTPEQLAVRLQVSREYVYRELLGQPDGIPAMKIGKGLRARWRIRPEDLEAWEDRHRVLYEPLFLTARLG